MAQFRSRKPIPQNGNSKTFLEQDDLQLVLGLSSTTKSDSGVSRNGEREVNQMSGNCILTGSSPGNQQTGGSQCQMSSFHSLREVNFNLTFSGHGFLGQSFYEAGSKSLAIFQGMTFSSDDGTSSRGCASHLRLKGNSFSDDSGSMLCNDIIGNTPRVSGVMQDEGSTSGAKRVKLSNQSVLKDHRILDDQRMVGLLEDGVLNFRDQTEEVLTSGNDVSSSKSSSLSLACEPSSTSGGGGQTSSSSRSKKMCKFPGCTRGARGSSGLCITHGGGRRCQKPNCTKGAESGTNFCKTHGGGPRCQSLGCLKSAEGKTDFCIAHGGGRRCNVEGCAKASRGKSGKCIKHGGGKRCQREGCNRSAEGISGLCISHGGGRRCQFPECTKGAQGSTMFCKAHGGGKRCVFEGCTKGAEGSTLLCKAHGGGKRCTFGGGVCTKSVHGGTLFCVAHGGGKRCSSPGCTKSARGRTDCCVRHGGGKRCKFEKCDKSAQGNTDFCKAHGGGKRSSCHRDNSIHKCKATGEKSPAYKAVEENTPIKGKTRFCASLEQCAVSSECMNSSSCSISMSASSSIHGLSEQFNKSVSSRYHESAELEITHLESYRGQVYLGQESEVEYALLNRGSDEGVVDTFYIPQNNEIITPTTCQTTTFPEHSSENLLLPSMNEAVMEKLQGGHCTLHAATDDPSVLSLPSLEERVHGGGIMALLAKGAKTQGASP